MCVFLKISPGDSDYQLCFETTGTGYLGTLIESPGKIKEGTTNPTSSIK